MAARRVVLFIAAFGLLTLGWHTSAGAAATQTVALYQLNEPAGASVMVDSSGNGSERHHRRRGDHRGDVLRSDRAPLPYVTPDVPPARPERIDNVPHDARLNPGTTDFAFTIRMRTTAASATSSRRASPTRRAATSSWRTPAESPPACSAARTARGVSAGRDLNDGEWHTIRCERTATGVSMTVDGTVVARLTGPTGSISNTWPLSIGGKYECDQINVTCDYFVGDIDWIRIETQGTPDTVAPSAPRHAGRDQHGRRTGQRRLDRGHRRPGGHVELPGVPRQLRHHDGTVSGGTYRDDPLHRHRTHPGAVHTYRVRASDGTNTGPRSAFSAPVTIAGGPTTTTTTTTRRRPWRPAHSSRSAGSVRSPSTGRPSPSRAPPATPTEHPSHGSRTWSMAAAPSSSAGAPTVSTR